MASIGFLIGGALINALAFSGSNFLFSSLSEESIDKEQKRHDKAIEDLQRAQIEWAKKRQELLDYIDNEIVKEHKAEKRFTDLNSAMQQYFLVTGCTFQFLGGCQGQRTGVGVTTVSNSLILGGWVTKVLKNDDEK